MTPREACHISDDPRDPDDAIPGLDDLDDEDKFPSKQEILRRKALTPRRPANPGYMKKWLEVGDRYGRN